MPGLRKTLRRLLAALVLLALLPVFPAAASSSVLTLPAGLKKLGAEAFSGDLSLQSVVLQEGAVSIGSRAFADSSLTEITLPASLTYIAPDAFENTSLTTVHAEKGTYAYQWMRENGYITEYRALLIGEQTFLWFVNESDPEGGCALDNASRRNVSDTIAMTDALGRTVGPRDAAGPAGPAFRVTRKTDLSFSGIRSAIKSTFADTQEQDISIVFIATHGKSAGDGDLRMAFSGSLGDPDQITAYWKNRTLAFSTLAVWLNTYVKGRVFIILESCGSGSAIYEPGVAENSDRRRASDSAAGAERFVSEAVQAFAAADPGIAVRPDGKGVRGNSTGDLRQPKFCVLAAARHHEDSYGWETKELSTSYNYFTRWLIQGIGSAGASPADTNNDG